MPDPRCRSSNPISPRDIRSSPFGHQPEVTGSRRHHPGERQRLVVGCRHASMLSHTSELRAGLSWNMTRRVAGILLLAGVLIAAVAGSRLGGARVAGIASPLPGLGAPVVGDCVAAVKGPVSVGFPKGSISVTTVGETSVRFSDCSDSHIGEVLAVQTVNDNPSDTLVNDRWCGVVATEYQSQALRRADYASGDHWTPVDEPRFMLIISALPGAHAYKWAACTLTSPGFETYGGSFVRSAAHGRVPAPFGVCRLTENTMAWASCSVPHRVQEFGTTSTPPTPDAGRSCIGLITAVTGMPDITAGGLLRPEVVRNTASSNEARLSCTLSVLGDRYLGSTLVGLGNGAVPWV